MEYSYGKNKADVGRVPILYPFGLKLLSYSKLEANLPLLRPAHPPQLLPVQIPNKFSVDLRHKGTLAARRLQIYARHPVSQDRLGVHQ